MTHWFSHLRPSLWRTAVDWFPVVVDWFSNLDPRIWQALIAGFFIAGGWVFNSWQNRRADRHRRNERRGDVQRAIRAEIAAFLSNMKPHELFEHRYKIVERMENDPKYVPHIPREPKGRLFEALVGEIHILPRTTIEPITEFYALLEVMEIYNEDLRGEWFQRLPQNIRIEAYDDYISLKIQVLCNGIFALEAIDVSSPRENNVAEADRTS